MLMHQQGNTAIEEQHTDDPVHRTLARGAQLYQRRWGRAATREARQWLHTERDQILSVLADAAVSAEERARVAVVLWDAEDAYDALERYLHIHRRLLAGELPAPLRVALLGQHAIQARLTGDNAAAVAAAGEAVALSRTPQCAALRASALLCRATVRTHLDAAAALTDAREALSIADTAESPEHVRFAAYEILTAWAPSAAERVAALGKARPLAVRLLLPVERAVHLYGAAEVLAAECLNDDAIAVLEEALAAVPPEHAEWPNIELKRVDLLLREERVAEAAAALPGLEQRISGAPAAHSFSVARLNVLCVVCALMQGSVPSALPPAVALRALADGEMAGVLRGYMPLVAFLIHLQTGELGAWSGEPFRHGRLLGAPLHDDDWLAGLEASLLAEHADDPGLAVRSIRRLLAALRRGQISWREFAAVGAEVQPAIGNIAAAFSGGLFALGAVLLAHRGAAPLSAAQRDRVDAIRAALAGADGQPGRARAEMSLALLHRALVRADVPLAPRQVVVIDPGGRRVQVDGDWVPMARRPKMFRLLQALSAATAPVTSDALIAAVWPGERMRHDSAQARLYSLITQARKLGVPIGRVGEGYVISPDLP